MQPAQKAGVETINKYNGCAQFKQKEVYYVLIRRFGRQHKKLKQHKFYIARHPKF